MKALLRQPYAINVAGHDFSLQERRVVFKILEILQPHISNNRCVDEKGNHLLYLTVEELRDKYYEEDESRNLVPKKCLKVDLKKVLGPYL